MGVYTRHTLVQCEKQSMDVKQSRDKIHITNVSISDGTCKGITFVRKKNAYIQSLKLCNTNAILKHSQLERTNGRLSILPRKLYVTVDHSCSRIYRIESIIMKKIYYPSNDLTLYVM